MQCYNKTPYTLHTHCKNRNSLDADVLVNPQKHADKEWKSKKQRNHENHWQVSLTIIDCKAFET